jgi:hypothetical protein
MADLTDVIGKTPEEIAAQAQQQHDAAVREAVEQYRQTVDAEEPLSMTHGALSPPPGFVGALAQFIYQQAPRPVPEVAIVGALGLMAGIAGKVWYKPSPDTGLNLYIVLVARSAIGKEAMLSGVAKLVASAAERCPFAGNFVDFSDFVSGPALVKSCLAWPSIVNVAGEIGHKFLAMSENKDGSMRSLRKQMTTLYSKSGPEDVAGGMIYSNQENNVASLKGVAYSIVGETTPGTFYQSITDEMMSDGFMSRFCVIEYTGDRPAKNRFPIQRPPQAVAEQLASIITHAYQAISTNQSQPVSFSGASQDLLDAFCDECDAAIVAAGDDEGQRQLWSRAELKALRVAALLAVGDNYLNPMVSAAQAEWAIALVRHGIAAFQSRIRLGEVGVGTDGGREQKMLDLCREFLLLPADKLPNYLKDGAGLQRDGIVPRKYLQQRTQRLAAFERHKPGHTAALNMAISTAVTNGNLMEEKKDKLAERYGYHGQAYRLLCLS